MAHNTDLVFYHSKSTAVADGETGHDDLGGRISADALTGLSCRPLVQMTGVTIVSASNSNFYGLGYLKFIRSASTLAWKAPRDSTYGTAVDVSGSGTFFLESATNNAWIQVTVTSMTLPSVDKTEKVILTLARNLLFSDIQASQMVDGLTTYRALFLKNTGATAMKNVRPYFEVLSESSETALQTYYSGTGAVTLEIEDPEGFPFSGFVRNVRTSEIMLYVGRSGERGEILTVPIEGRALRDTGPGEGQEGDTMELVAPLDLFLESYNPTLGAASIARESLAPDGATFSYPDPSDEPQYGSVFTLAAGGILTIWLRREVPAGANVWGETTYRLSFKYDDV